MIFLMSGLLSQAQHMFFHMLPGFVTPFTWVGLGGDANWSTPANWNTGVVPSASDIATFDNTCVSNCDPTIDVPVAVNGVNIKSSYAGTITQAGGQTITIGTAGWTQAGGTFAGGDSNFVINSGFLSLTNTTVFNSTSAELFFDAQQAANVTLLNLDASATFTFPMASSTRFRLQGNCGGITYAVTSPQVIQFQSLTTETHTIGCGSPSFGGLATQFWINNSYEHTSAESIQLLGDYELLGSAYVNSDTGNSATLRFTGGASRTIMGPGGFPNVVIDQVVGGSVVPITTSQSLKFAKLEIKSGEFTFPETTSFVWNGPSATFFKIHAGTTVNVPANSTVNIDSQGVCGPKTRTIDTGGVFNFENLNISGSYTGCGSSDMSIAPGTSLVVKKDFSLGTDVIANFDITVEGQVTLTGATFGNMGIATTTGNSKSISQNSTTSISGLISINKPSGTLTASTNLVFNNTGQDLNVSNGTMDLAGRSLTVNDVVTVGASGKILCNGGSVIAGSWVVNGEVSCGTTIGITWTGLAGDNLWSSAGNWTNNTVPGVSDVAIFNGMCAGANCNAQINSNLSVRGIVLMSSYTGTLTQNSSRTLTIGTAGFTQAGGTFVGGDSAVGNSGPLMLSAGVFTSTSDTWTQLSTISITGTSVFNHNSGTLLIDSGINLTAHGVTFFNLTFSGNQANSNLNNGVLTVLGVLTLSDPDATYPGNINSGTIDVKNGFVVANYGKGGNAVLRWSGTAAQTLTGIATGRLPSIEINKPSGTLTMVGTITVMSNWTYTAGTVDAGTSTLNFWNSNTIIPGSMTYYNVGFYGQQSNHDLSAGTMLVDGTLTLSDSDATYPGNLNNGTVEVRGNTTAINYGKGGNATISFVSTGSQSITGIGTGRYPSILVNKPSGTLTMVGTITVMSNWTYTAGTVDAGTSTLNFWSSNTIIPGSMTYYNVGFYGQASNHNLSAGTMLVDGALALADAETVYTGNLNNGTIEVRGNLTATSYGKGGNATISFVGTGSQSITGISTSLFPSILVNKPSGTLAMVGTIRVMSNWTYTAGTVDAGTSTLNFLSANTIIPGSMTYYNVGFYGDSSNHSLSSGTMVVGGTLTLSDANATYPGSLNNGTIEVRGDVRTSSAGKLGDATLIMNGASSGNLHLVSSRLLNTDPTLAKTGGASVVLTTNAPFTAAGRNVTVSSGLLDLNGYDLTVNATLNIGVGTTLRCNGGEFTSGSLSNSGTINCPGYAGYEFNWTGAGGNSDWTNAGNWQGGVAPSSTSVVAFQDSTCGGTCNSTINTAATVRGVRIYSPFSGTISQSNGNALTVGARGWSQQAGTFIGSNANMSIQNTLTLSGGSFTATSATTNSRGVIFTGTPSFSHNNGHWLFAGTSLGLNVTSTPSIVFNDVTFGGTETRYTISGTVAVSGDLIISDTLGSSYYTYSQMNGGTVDVSGNLSNVGWGKNGTTNIRIVGNPAGQTITGIAGGLFPEITIDAGTNPVTLSGTLRTYSTFTMSSVGAFNVAGSTIQFNDTSGGGTQVIVPGNVSYNNISFMGHNTTYNLSSGTLNVLGSLIISDTGSWAGLRNINSGTINASGDVQVLANGSNGSAHINFVGLTDTNLSMSPTSYFPRGTMTINKSSPAKVTLLSNSRFNGIGNQNLTIGANSTLDMAGFDLAVGNNISNSGTLRRGTSPTCGTITLGGTITGNAAICPP